MLRARIIPALLLKGTGLVKTIRFKDPVYVGDPINAVRLFNDLEADELILLDIMASRERREPNFEQLQEIVSEAFMPICYGGGITKVEHAERLFHIGLEKVGLTTGAVESPALVDELARAFGSQSIVVGLDVRRDWRGRPQMYTRGGSSRAGMDALTFVHEMVERGAGEILLNLIDRDGTRDGYDLGLIADLSKAANVPLVACGGAGSLADLRDAIAAGASAAAAGSLFVFKGPHRAVLINYPSEQEADALFEVERA